ncbi:MAG TPA: LysR substrate-binding domain-containing protein, partial [Armatimonadota bacterium]|nr:LysR substrate-binding domain-containing protein [Armatimonadota bacterium]
PPLLSSFHDTFPKIHLKLQTGDASQALPQVLDALADISVAPLPNNPPDQLAFRRLVETPLVFVIPKVDCAVRNLFLHDDIDFSQVPMVLPESELARRRIDVWFQAKGIDPLIYALVAGNEAIIAMVSLGVGAGVLPRLVAESSPLKEQIEVVPINPPLEPYCLCLCVLKRRLASPVVRAFWEQTVFSTDYA